MRASHTIVLASTNHDKLVEFRSLLKPYGDLELVAANEIICNADKLSLVETHDTYLDNALAKARLANQGAHYPCLADDSGLEVQALEGKPGVHTRRYANPAAGQSQDDANIQKLLSELRGVPADRRVARFVTALAFIVEGIIVTATGTLEGTIAEAPRGTHGFGYDPIFIPKGGARTLGEMSDDDKNMLSHRSRALKDLFAQIEAKGIALVKP
jgi:XTP/dITP diphosphohydrolase